MRFGEPFRPCQRMLPVGEAQILHPAVQHVRDRPGAVQPRMVAASRTIPVSCPLRACSRSTWCSTGRAGSCRYFQVLRFREPHLQLRIDLLRPLPRGDSLIQVQEARWVVVAVEGLVDGRGGGKVRGAGREHLAEDLLRRGLFFRPSRPVTTYSWFSSLPRVDITYPASRDSPGVMYPRPVSTDRPCDA